MRWLVVVYEEKCGSILALKKRIARDMGVYFEEYEELVR